MHGVYSDTALVLPSDWLVWLATSSARMALYRLQGWHGPLRLLHVGGTWQTFVFFDDTLKNGRNLHHIFVGLVAEKFA